MASILDRIPAPSRQYERQAAAEPSAAERLAVRALKEPPAYGKRTGFVPRRIEDYGDGGAFPEIHVAQYPLDMGRPDGGKGGGAGGGGGTLALTVNAEGDINYDAVVAQSKNAQKWLQTTHKALVPKPDELLSGNLEKPDEDEIEKTARETAAALALRVDKKQAAVNPKTLPQQPGAAQYIKYTPADGGPQHASGAGSRIIKMQDMPVDPLEPPKFRHIKVPRGAGSPPVPVMHSPPRPLTVKDQQDWKIPPCISNWKNSKGYTIPLDKRLAADGRGLQEVAINDQFAKFTEALYIAEQKARSAVEARSKMQRELLAREKERKERELRELALKARMDRPCKPCATRPPAQLRLGRQLRGSNTAALGFPHPPAAMEAQDKRSGLAIQAVGSALGAVERSAASSSSEDAPVCWICLDSQGPLIFPCKCPRTAHPRCLARWQLQSAGSRKETHCEFCDLRLPDWKGTLTPQCGANAPAVMNVNFDGRTYSFEVKPGPDGYRQFTESIRRAFNLPDDSELNITFTCDEPSTGVDNGSLLTLQGSGAYDAAVHCASVSAARRLTSPGVSRTVSAAEEFMSLPSTPGPINSMGGAAAASPEALSPEGSGVDAGALGGSKRRLSGSLRRLRSALQEFASALSSGAGGSGAGMRP